MESPATHAHTRSYNAASARVPRTLPTAAARPAVRVRALSARATERSGVAKSGSSSDAGSAARLVATCQSRLKVSRLLWLRVVASVMSMPGCMLPGCMQVGVRMCV